MYGKIQHLQQQVTREDPCSRPSVCTQARVFARSGGHSTQAHYTVQNHDAGQRSRQRSTDLTPTSFALASSSLMLAFKQRRSLATCQRSLRRHPGGRQTEKCTCPQSITLGTLQTPNRHPAGTLQGTCRPEAVGLYARIGRYEHAPSESSRVHARW